MNDDMASALALLEWQIELGVTEALSEEPLCRFVEPEAANAQPMPKAAAQAPAQIAPNDPISEAKARAKTADSLGALRTALAAFDGCALKKGARNMVFADGQPGASVMVIGEAPGRDEDIAGKPFVGRAGGLLDKMFAAIDLARDRDGQTGLYITNIMPWRPPQNRDPKPDEIAMLRPFVEQHIRLAAPKLIVLMGNISCHAMIGQRGITKLRGTWSEIAGIPALPMFHPAYLLRNPYAKRQAWLDLLTLNAKLNELSDAT